MTNTAISAPFAEGYFRVGRVINQSASVLSRNFPALFLIGAIAYLPIQLAALWLTSLREGVPAGVTQLQVGIAIVVLVLTTLLFGMFSQAVILHTAFQSLRHQPTDIVESLKVGLRRIFFLFLLAIVVGIVALLVTIALGLAVGAVIVTARGSIYPFVATIVAFILALVVFAILCTMWFVSVAACVVERKGPFGALGRSQALTKGNRWRIFGLMLLLFITSFIISLLIGLILSPIGSMIVTFLGNLAWSAIWGAYFATAVAVSYHDLRVAKEGVDIEQIASVFD
jgi:MFS family permease